MLLTCASLMVATAIAIPAEMPQSQKRTATGAPKEGLAHDDLPSTKWKGRRYAGNGVTITYYAYWIYISDYDYDFDSKCILSCQGKKHFLHQACDITCDSICTTEHEKTIKPKFEYSRELYGVPYLWHTGMEKLITKAGGNNIQTYYLADKIRNDAMKPIKASIDKYSFKFKSGHWNKTPCSVHIRDFKYSTYSLFASYTVYKDGKAIGSGGGILGETDLLGTIKVPHKKFYDQKPVENCKCEFDKRKNRDLRIGGLVPLEGEGESELRFAGLYIDPESDGKFAQYNETHTADVAISYRLDDLNNFSVIATNMTMMPIGLALMPGSTFVPEQDDFQSMVNLDMLQWSVGPNSTREFVVPISGPLQDPITLGGFMACLDMGKKQPDGSAPYSLGSTLDSRVIDMGYDMAVQRFRGPWNQAQLWIYTNGASRKEINDRLFPPVSETRYLNALYELANTYHVDLNNRKYNDVWSPDLMLADGAPLEQLQWFVDEMTVRDARKLADWLKGNAGEFSYLFASDAQDWYIEHAANVATALCNSDQIEVQAAGLNFLTQFVPQSKRAELIANGGLEGAVSVAIGDGRNASTAMAVVEQYDAELAAQLKTVPEELPYPVIDPPFRSK